MGLLAYKLPSSNNHGDLALLVSESGLFVPPHSFLFLFVIWDLGKRGLADLYLRRNGFDRLLLFMDNFLPNSRWSSTTAGFIGVFLIVLGFLQYFFSNEPTQKKRSNGIS